MNYQQIEGPPGQEHRRPAQRPHRLGRPGRPPIHRCRLRLNVGVAGEGDLGGLQAHSGAPQQHEQCGAHERRLQSAPPSTSTSSAAGATGRGVDANFFPDYSTGVGSFFVSFFPISLARAPGVRPSVRQLQHHAPRALTTSRIASAARSTSRLGSRALLISGYGLTGPNNYPRPQPVIVEATSWSSGATRTNSTAAAFRSCSDRPLVLHGPRRPHDVNSNIPTDSRAYTRYTVMLSFSGTFPR